MSSVLCLLSYVFMSYVFMSYVFISYVFMSCVYVLCLYVLCLYVRCPTFLSEFILISLSLADFRKYPLFSNSMEFSQVGAALINTDRWTDRRTDMKTDTRLSLLPEQIQNMY